MKEHGYAKLDTGLKVSFGITITGWDANGDAVIVTTLPDHDLDFVLEETCTLKAYPASLSRIASWFGAHIVDSFPPRVTTSLAPARDPSPSA